MSKVKPKLCFLIRSLNRGGSETQFIEFIKRIPPEAYDISVITFYSEGELSYQLRSLSHIHFATLDKKGRWDLLPMFFRLHTQIKNQRPDLLHSYLETANIASALIKIVHPRLKIVWGIRSAGADYQYFDKFAALSWSLQRLLSNFPTLIITNSKKGAEYIKSYGFPRNKILSIPNGIDTNRFQPNAALRTEMRKQLHIPESAKLIGIAARLDPLKDHHTFLKAASQLCQRRSDVRFICVGGGKQQFLERLKDRTAQLGLTKCVRWVGAQEDMISFYNAIDILCSTSLSEGFSNVIAEAMSCGTPCVVTDVGDSRDLVADSGFSAPPQQPEQIAKCLEDLLAHLDKVGPAVGTHARQRIVENFSATQMVERTLTALDTLLIGNKKINAHR